MRAKNKVALAVELSIHIDLYTSYGIYQTKLTSLKSIKSCLHLEEAIVDYCSPVAVIHVVAIIHYDNGICISAIFALKLIEPLVS